MNLIVFLTFLVAGFSAVFATKWPVVNGVPCACSRLDMPVCGHDGQDYPNPECAKNCGKVTGFRRGTCERPARCGCPYSEEPVCARRPNGELDTFDSHCIATCSNGAEVVHKGRCISSPEHPIAELPDQLEHLKRSVNRRMKKNIDDSDDEICICTLHYSPVCGLKNGEWIDYGNHCAARCAKVERTKNGRCDKGGSCACGRDYNPVCARKPDGTLKDYSNQCTADCEDAVTVSHGRCSAKPDNSLPDVVKRAIDPSCICTKHRAPVCALKDGQWRVYSNACVARCLSATSIRSEPCDKYSDESRVKKAHDKNHVAQRSYDDDEYDDKTYDDETYETEDGEQIPVFQSLFRRWVQ